MGQSGSGIKKNKRSYERRKSRVGLYFIGPWIMGTVFFFLIPVVESFFYSIGTLEVTGRFFTITGFGHYIRAFTEDSVFVQYLANSVWPMVYQVPITIVLSLFMAMLINQKFPGRVFVRAIFFLPIMIANGIIIWIMRGDAFSQMLSGQTGTAQMFSSEMLRMMMNDMGVGASVIQFIAEMVDSIFNLLWKSGIQTLLFLAALQTIPVHMYEAAKMEGGTAWENFWKITFPMLSPTILLNLIYSIVDNFNDYNNMVVRYVNDWAGQGIFEYSAALAWVYAVLVMFIIGVVYLAINRFVYYEK